MGRHKTSGEFVGASPPFPCFFGCGRQLDSKYTREARAWTWFCGYGVAPVHFCPHCQTARRAEIVAIRNLLDQRPAGYPKEFASPLQLHGKSSRTE
jgi:hypothetical protein